MGQDKESSIKKGSISMGQEQEGQGISEQESMTHLPNHCHAA